MHISNLVHNRPFVLSKTVNNRLRDGSTLKRAWLGVKPPPSMIPPHKLCFPGYYRTCLVVRSSFLVDVAVSTHKKKGIQFEVVSTESHQTQQNQIKPKFNQTARVAEPLVYTTSNHFGGNWSSFPIYSRHIISRVVHRVLVGRKTSVQQSHHKKKIIFTIFTFPKLSGNPQLGRVCGREGSRFQDCVHVYTIQAALVHATALRLGAASPQGCSQHRRKTHPGDRCLSSSPRS